MDITNNHILCDLPDEDPTCPICGSNLDDSGICEDVGDNTCNYIGGINDN